MWHFCSNSYSPLPSLHPERRIFLGFLLFGGNSPSLYSCSYHRLHLSLCHTRPPGELFWLNFCPCLAAPVCPPNLPASFCLSFNFGLLGCPTTSVLRWVQAKITASYVVQIFFYFLKAWQWHSFLAPYIPSGHWNLTTDVWMQNKTLIPGKYLRCHITLLF